MPLKSRVCGRANYPNKTGDALMPLFSPINCTIGSVPSPTGEIFKPAVATEINPRTRIKLTSFFIAVLLSGRVEAETKRSLLHACVWSLFPAAASKPRIDKVFDPQISQITHFKHGFDGFKKPKTNRPAKSFLNPQSNGTTDFTDYSDFFNHG